MELLRQTPSLIGTAVEELLRDANPLEMATTRLVGEKLTVNGTTIPRGAMVMAVLASANRDEKQFDHPDELKPKKAEQRSRGVRTGSSLLRWCAVGTSGRANRDQHAPAADAEVATCVPGEVATLEGHARAARLGIIAGRILLSIAQ